MSIRLSQATLDVLHAHAREAYPDECCGMVVERAGAQHVERVTNIQNQLHEQDPQQFPRTAAIAYTMGREAAPVLMAAERGKLTLRAIYHSHPDHDAYFSAEDRTQAMGGWDEPNYPAAAQIVISVRGGEVRATKAFICDATLRDFIETALVVE